MSQLENIIIECVNKALDGREEKLGDYIDPTKEQLKSLFIELIKDTDFAYKDATAYADVLCKKVEAL